MVHARTCSTFPNAARGLQKGHYRDTFGERFRYHEHGQFAERLPGGAEEGPMAFLFAVGELIASLLFMVLSFIYWFVGLFVRH